MTTCTAAIVGPYSDVRRILTGEGYSVGHIDDALDRHIEQRGRCWHVPLAFCEDDVQRLRVLINMRIFGMAP